MRTKLLILILSTLLILPVSASPLVKVEVFNNTHYESLTLLKPGNWIKMTGGHEVIIPNIKMVYNGINSTQYTKGGKTINITTYGIQENQDYVVNYPFTKYPVYYQGDAITAELLGTSDLAGKTAYIYLIKTYPTQLKNALTSAVDGDTQPLRNLLSNAVQNKTVNLDSSGDATVSFGQLSPGDYVVVALLNKSTDANITFVSATAFEVLEYKSSLDVSNITRSSVNDNIFLDGTFTITGGSSNAKYTYVAALVRKDAYSIEFRLESGGTKATTDLKANNATLIKSFKVGGVGLKNVNATTVYNWIEDAFPSNSASVEKGRAGNTYDFSLPVSGLLDGEYYLCVAAWNSSKPSQRVVAFSQAIVKITTTTTFEVTPKSISKEITRGRSTSVTLTVSNTGNYELRGVKLSASGDVASWISFSPNTITSIAAGKSGSVTVNIAVPSGASLGTHTGVIHVTSENGGSKNVSVSVKVKTPPLIAGGGGGGGGGVVVTPPPGVEAEYSEGSTIPANTEVRFELPPMKAEATGVVAVTIKVPERMTLEMKVSKLKALPAGVPEPAVRIYRILDITFTKLGTNIGVKPSGYIEFKVSKSWMAENGYAPSNVVLMKYHEGWKELKTELVKEDGKYYYYRAETESFSIFAIAVKAPVTVTTTTTATTTIPATTTVTTTTPAKPWIPGFTVLAAAIAIVIAAIALRRR